MTPLLLAFLLALQPTKDIEVEQDGKYRTVVERDLASVDAAVPLEPTRGQKWRIHLRAGETRIVVVRGLRFFNASGEIFPPSVPYGRSPKKATTEQERNPIISHG
jgi:hypothetical protein